MEHLRSRSRAGWATISDTDASRLAVWLGSAVLVLVCTLAILRLPFIFSVALPVALLATLIVARHPTGSLIAVFFGRITVDLLWWAPAGLGLNFMEVFTGGITVLLVVMCLISIHRVLEHPFLPGIALWTLMLLVGAAQQPEMRVVAELLARFLSPMLILLLVSIHFEDEMDQKRLFVGLAAGGILPIALGLFYLATGQAATMQLSGYDRLSGGYSNIADHGLSMATFAMVGLVWLWHYGRRWQSIAISAYIGLSVLLLVLTYTRTPLVGLTAFAFVFLLLQGNRRLLLVVGVLMATVLATNSVAIDRFSDFSEFFTVDAGYQTDRLGSGRIGIWRRSFEAFFSQPFLQILLGNGLNSQYLLAEGQDSHSDYISLLLQVGPIGLFIWAGFQIEVARRAYLELDHASTRWRRTLLVTVVALSIGVLICNSLSNAYVSRVTMSWIWCCFAGLALAIQAERKTSKKGISQPA